MLKVGELTTSVGSSYVWQALKRPFRSADKRSQALLDTHIRNALRIVESSKELKGAFMKLVQMLSMRDDLLPAGGARGAVGGAVAGAADGLRRRSATQVKRELGSEPEKLFASFEPEAFAAASLGQVHRATLPQRRRRRRQGAVSRASTRRSSRI